MMRRAAATACVALALGTAGAGAGQARAQPAGFPDPAFGSAGRAEAPFGAGARAAAVALGPAGTLAVAGDLRDSSGERTLVARFTAAGALDPSFNGGGARLDRFGAEAASPQRGRAIAVTAGGGTIVAGVAGDQIMVAKYLPGGQPDGLFGAGGTVLRELSGGAGMPAGAGLAALALTPAGQIVVAGSVGVPAGDPYEQGRPGEQVVVGRLSARGVPDPSFGSGGFALLQLGARSARRPARSRAAALALLPDGRIAIAGGASDTRGSERAVIARLSPAGRLDASFARAGRTLVQLGLASAARLPRSSFHALAAGPDGSLLAGGSGTDVAGNEQAVLARLLPGGGADTGFGRRGVVRAQLDDGERRAPASIVRGLAPVASGGAFVTGSSSGGGALASRVTARGRLDCTFGSRGYGAGFGPLPGRPGDPVTDGAFAALAQPDGNLVLAGRGARGGLLLGRMLGGAGAARERPPRPRLLTLAARYLGRGRAIAYGVVDAHCAGATVRFAATGGGRRIISRSQRVSGAFGRQVVCARLRGLRPGRAHRLRIESPRARGAAGGTRLLRAVVSPRPSLAQEGCA